MSELQPGNVFELRPGDLTRVTDTAVINPDRVLEANMGRFSKVFVVGIEAGSDELVIAGSHAMSEMYFHLGLGMREIEKVATT